MQYFVKELPEGCNVCDCCYTKPYDYWNRIDGEKFCGILNEDVEVYYYHGDSRPDWCPLREIPKLREITNNCDDYLDGIDVGWNDCVIEMIGY